MIIVGSSMSEYFKNLGFDNLSEVDFDLKLSYARSLAFYTGIIQFGLGVFHISKVANYLSGTLSIVPQ